MGGCKTYKKLLKRGSESATFIPIYDLWFKRLLLNKLLWDDNPWVSDSRLNVDS